MTNQKLDIIDLLDRADNAQDSCYGVIRGLQLMQQNDDEDSPLAGVLLKSLDEVYSTLADMTDYLKQLDAAG